MRVVRMLATLCAAGDIVVLYQFQPIVELQAYPDDDRPAGRHQPSAPNCPVLGAEALVRWNLPFVSRVATGVPTPMISIILALASALDLSVIAEGIEQPARADELLARGCTRGRGWLFGRPAPLGALRLTELPPSDLAPPGPRHGDRGTVTGRSTASVSPAAATFDEVNSVDDALIT